MMSDYWHTHRRAQGILARLEAAAEDTRQRELTESLGQVECRGYHGAPTSCLYWRRGACYDCGAAL